MAISNVRFYKLGVLPPFNVDKHKGIFVHVTGIMDKNGGNPKNPNTLLMNIKSDTLVQWLTERRIDKIASGLWFGGENGWELLSNDTTSGAIDAAINDKINALDVEGYVQAGMSNDGTDSTLTIKGIQEVDGKIGTPADSENLDFDIAIDGVYNENTNKIATESTVTNVINGLNVDTIQAVTTAQAEDNNANTVLTFNGIKEANGKILQGDGTSKFTVGDAKLKIQIGSNEDGAFEVFSANAQSNGAIKLDENVFKKEGDAISVITLKNDVSSSNPLVTKDDIASLNGAMHYKGPLTGAQSGVGSWPSTIAAGDVYIVTTSFTHSGESNPFEVGDMIVFNTDNNNSDYTVVQSNITLGIEGGQIAKNDGKLTPNNMVIATSNGIKTIGITETQLTSSNDNTRKLNYDNGAPDTSDATLFHSATIKDTFKVIGKDFTETINISSTNRSIKIARNAGDNDSTGVVVDLVWNTSMDPDPNN